MDRSQVVDFQYHPASVLVLLRSLLAYGGPANRWTWVIPGADFRSRERQGDTTSGFTSCGEKPPIVATRWVDRRRISGDEVGATFGESGVAGVPGAGRWGGGGGLRTRNRVRQELVLEESQH
jgi:hypothetical protein